MIVTGVSLVPALTNAQLKGIMVTSAADQVEEAMRPKAVRIETVKQDFLASSETTSSLVVGCIRDSTSNEPLRHGTILTVLITPAGLTPDQFSAFVRSSQHDAVQELVNIARLLVDEPTDLFDYNHGSVPVDVRVWSRPDSDEHQAAYLSLEELIRSLQEVPPTRQRSGFIFS